LKGMACLFLVRGTSSRLSQLRATMATPGGGTLQKFFFLQFFTNMVLF
jgi:hypothetical protein